jgi:hypothetical protein
MTYVAITDAEIDVDSPLTQVLMTKYRDNIEFAIGPISTTVISTPVASVGLTGFDAALFTSYEIEFQNIIPSTDAVDLNLRTSTNGGATYDSGGSDYRYAGTVVVSSSATVAASVSAGAAQGLIAGSVGSIASEDGASGIIRVVGPNLAKNTIMNYQVSYDDSGGAYRSVLGGIQRVLSTDVDAVQIFFSAGNIESGTIIFRGIA